MIANLRQPQLGPTVYDAAKSEVAECSRQIAELIDRKHAAMRRMVRYASSKMLESERLATAAEPYQAKQLTE